MQKRVTTCKDTQNRAKKYKNENQREIKMPKPHTSQSQTQSRSQSHNHSHSQRKAKQEQKQKRPKSGLEQPQCAASAQKYTKISQNPAKTFKNIENVQKRIKTSKGKQNKPYHT